MSADLIGRWELLRWEGRREDGERVLHGGERPRGDLIYLQQGRMAVQICHDGRPGFGSQDLEAGGTEARAAAFGGYIAYAGRFSLPEPGVVVHHVEISLHPDQAGMDKRRCYVLADEELALRTQPVLYEGAPASSLLRWRRVQRL